ncbi:unnamed protein product [Caenorhabditis nigoni]
MSPKTVRDVYNCFVIPEEKLKKNGYLYFESESSNRAQFMKNDKWSNFAFMSDEDNTRKCSRCSRLFNRKSTFSYPNLCQFHPLKREIINGFVYHLCCLQRVGTSKGCTTHSFHVHQQPSEKVLEEFVQTPKPASSRDYRSNKIFALDVEMIHTEDGLEAGRISLVDREGRIMIDEYIRPEGKIIHLNTQFSGIQEFHLENAKSLKQIHQLMFQFVNRSTLLIGHGLSNDLKVLRLVHLNVIDTGLLEDSSNGRMPSLKALARKWLNKEIQNTHEGHDSIEDAITCLDIVEEFIECHCPDLSVNV